MILISIHAPRAGGDTVCAAKTGATSDFNPRPPCGGRHSGHIRRPHRQGISIHAPRAGGDTWPIFTGRNSRISIHAPRAGGDVVGLLGHLHHLRHFNPRPPCGGRQKLRGN